MRPRLVRGLVAGWVVLAVAGWGLTRWAGEPAATSGPARVVPPASGAEPGPQPESDCAAAAARGADRSRDGMPEPAATAPGHPSSAPGARPVPIPASPEPSATGAPTKGPIGRDGVQTRVTSVLCDYAVYESP
ncbi:hypothetical protein EAO72_30810 [Streptomyces sp. or43]|nr:hypothetical protein EAO72_30810 [Streptomyces sp. or43]